MGFILLNTSAVTCIVLMQRSLEAFLYMCFVDISYAVALGFPLVRVELYVVFLFKPLARIQVKSQPITRVLCVIVWPCEGVKV